MNEALAQFGQKKEEELNQKKEARAEITLRYYDKITYMIGCGKYDEQESFLYSVQQFIEEKEYISDKQIEVVDRILNDGYDREYLEQPF